MISPTKSLASLQTSGGNSIELLGVLLLTIMIVGGFWKAFQKAGKPGWAAVIPIYNLYVLVKVSGNSWWWFLMFFMPVLNFFATLKVSINVASKFNRGVLFSLGLMFLPFIFYPILGFGDYQYQGATQLS